MFKILSNRERTIMLSFFQGFYQNNKNVQRLPIFIKNHEFVEWKAPTLFCNDEIMFGLIDVCNLMKIKLPIKHVFGSVKCSWSGGRSSKIREFDEEYISKIIKKYNDNGIGCSFTFTNYYITETMLDDAVGNKILEIASRYDDNYAIVSSDILANYIRKKYPKIKLESSLLKPTYECPGYTETPKYYDNLCERYDKVVVRPELGQDFNFLKKLKNKEKIEILVNGCCVYKCPFSIQHYDRAVALENGTADSDIVMCNSRFLDPVSMHKNVFLSNNDVDKLIKLGFSNFKLNGRNTTPMSLLHIIGTYVFDSSGVYQYLLNYMALSKKVKLS